MSESEGSLVCDCGINHCKHTDILSDHLDFILKMEPEFATAYPSAYLVCERNGKERFIFLVRGISVEGHTGGKCVLVMLMHDGSWRCSSCTTRGHCHHKLMAQNHAQDAGIIDKCNSTLQG